MTTGFNTSFGMGSNQYSTFNNPPVDKKNASEYKKIFCAYHSSEFLTNFCTDSIYDVIQSSVWCLCALLV